MFISPKRREKDMSKGLVGVPLDVPPKRGKTYLVYKRLPMILVV
jgi:hypothetical protein